MSAEDYAANVSALVDAKLEKPKNYAEQGNRYWNEIGKGTYLFDRAEREAAEAKTISKEELIDFLGACVGRREGGGEGGGEDGRKLVVVIHGSSHPVPPVGVKETGDGGSWWGGEEEEEGEGGRANGGGKGKRLVKVRDPGKFRRGHALYPLRPQIAVKSVGVAEACSSSATA
ncbi:hypothetical protein NSK_006351 [Nannochloropsis salina CCMP1776]|jgi:hypothetical protein|uniref:Uncharacterized protein n=1 Tax=Nannochloropsis salina CCMP1776 TaxID=1027361 RepID=A0A4D9CSZ3_9STRA|nr:hypothetical protein NSK_006351 [Nannochloropsis salina CCMP1776]|eukprot:TFJ82341.1 hypothetical protein NSK_006351 [Nannochloropsis salina CCMP1776]